MNGQTVIRPLQESDNSAIANIIRTVLSEFKANKPGTVFYDPTTDELFQLFQQEKAAYFIAEQDGKITGGAGVYPTSNLPEGYCELVKLYLLEETRGKGIGKALIEKCLQTACTFGYTHVYLESMPELIMAVGLYERMGFEYLPGPLGNSGHFGCDIWMVRKL